MDDNNSSECTPDDQNNQSNNFNNNQNNNLNNNLINTQNSNTSNFGIMWGTSDNVNPTPIKSFAERVFLTVAACILLCLFAAVCFNKAGWINF